MKYCWHTVIQSKQCSVITMDVLIESQDGTWNYGAMLYCIKDTLKKLKDTHTCVYCNHCKWYVAVLR